MQVVHIVPGSGGSFYCGNCLRDSTYVNALQKAGVEVIKIPMYLPLFADEHDLADVPVFYGAISLYLKHVFPIFQKIPKWVDRMLNSGPALKLAAKMAGSTNSRGLEDMTISMLMGEHGEQKKELDQLVEWMSNYSRADVVHISNALLLGLAHKIREKLDVPVVCSLQDEDTWVNVMDMEFAIKTWELMREKSRDVDAFFVVSKYFADKMSEKLDIPADKLLITHIGLDPEEYSFRNALEKEPAIGYVSRMCHDNGLEVLVDAFIILKKNPAMQPVKLRITGGSTGVDNKFLKGIRKKINKSGLQEDVIFHKDFEEKGRHEFFEKVNIISVPVLEGEAFGIYLLESMASGIPVVQPNLGAFKEIVALAGGGVIYEPNTPEALAKELGDLIQDPKRHGELSKNGRKGVEKHFNIHFQAARMREIYKKMLDKKAIGT